MELRIAHLSDIHFRNEPQQIGHDPNESMREDVIQDLEKLVAEFGSLDALVVSGDIAYSGKPEEFSLARAWFYNLLERTSSQNAKILICPGNHDIDRAVFSVNQSILDSHDAIRTSKNPVTIEQALTARLTLPADKELLMKSLENYNNFAIEYECDFYPNKQRYSWHHDFTLNDGSVLRFRGLNSTMLCGKKDTEGSLFLGRSAWNIQRQDGIEYATFSHHPPSWLFDEKEMKNELDDRAKIQLYGHEHSAKIAPGVNSVRLFAGAVNPERDHADWKPGYNFLRVSVKNVNSQRELMVIIHSREWQQTLPSQFKEYRGKEPDGTHKYTFGLRPWSPRAVNGATSPNSIVTAISKGTSKEGEVIGESSQPSSSAMNEQEFLRRFFDLSFVEQKSIFEELSLSDAKESSAAHFVQIKNSLARAKERGLLGVIARKI